MQFAEYTWQSAVSRVQFCRYSIFACAAEIVHRQMAVDCRKYSFFMNDALILSLF